MIRTMDSGRFSISACCVIGIQEINGTLQEVLFTLMANDPDWNVWSHFYCLPRHEDLRFLRIHRIRRERGHRSLGDANLKDVVSYGPTLSSL